MVENLFGEPKNAFRKFLEKLIFLNQPHLLFLFQPSRTLRDVPDVDDNLTEKNENDSRGSDVVEDSGDQSVFVPLEFSSGGGETRVLTDPEEIKEIDCYQVERYYQRNYVRVNSSLRLTSFLT